MSSSQPLVPSKLEVKCERCKCKNKLKNILSERRLPEPNQNTVEGVLICPDCGLETHCYYLSDEAMVKRGRILTAIQQLASQNTVPVLIENIRKLQELREQHQKIYDDEQEFYRKLFEKAAVSDGTAK